MLFYVPLEICFFCFTKPDGQHETVLHQSQSIFIQGKHPTGVSLTGNRIAVPPGDAQHPTNAHMCFIVQMKGSQGWCKPMFWFFASLHSEEKREWMRSACRKTFVLGAIFSWNEEPSHQAGHPSYCDCGTISFVRTNSMRMSLCRFNDWQLAYLPGGPNMYCKCLCFVSEALGLECY